MRLISIPEKLVDMVHSKMNSSNFLLFSSLLVGLTAGLAAVFLKTSVHFIHTFLHQYSDGRQIIFAVLPIVGILLTVIFVQKFLKGKLERGTSNIIFSIIKRSGFLPKEQMYTHIITSGITLGFGGSAGLESPIVNTGAAIGSNYSKRYRLSYKERILLLACGSAAGTAAIFNSPIAGVLFSLEVLLVDISISSFIPLLLSAAVGALCSKIILKEEILLSFHNIQPFNYNNVGFYIILGIFCGLVSVYYVRMVSATEHFFKPMQNNYLLKVLIGGLLLAILILLFPPLFGEGYGSIKALSHGKASEILTNSVLSEFFTGNIITLIVIAAIMFVKVFATSLTLNSGGNGGNFAPSLFTGAFLGFLFSHSLNLFDIGNLPESNFILVGMCGILTGVFHAPLTSIFLIAEITGGYELMIPLMMVSAISYSVAKYFEPMSIEAKALAKKGKISRDDRDKTILSALSISPLLETDFQTLSTKTKLKELVEILSQSKRNIFPVVDKNNKLVGIVTLDQVREIMFKVELYEKVVVKELMIKPPTIISIDEDMHAVMKKFDESGSWNLPVVKEGIYSGFISKSSLLAQYRVHLINSSIG